MRLYHISFLADKDLRIRLGIEADSVNCIDASGKTSLFFEAEEGFFLMPALPVLRSWNRKRHILRESWDYLTEYGDKRINFRVDLRENESFDFLMLCSSSAGDLSPFLEVPKGKNREYTLTGPWVVISPLLDCWRFMVNGSVYEYREGIGSYARFPSQQAALFLYKLVHLERVRLGAIADAVKGEIAHSVLLDLQPDGRWVHGCWSEDMETHTRFHVDGIHLLLDYFEETGESVFLEKALLAASYLLSLTDTLSGGTLWFLHDTMELGGDYIYPVRRSKAFGKSETNTLCLNTHLSALCVLIRLYRKTGKEEFREAIKRGLGAARMVLEEEPATSLYRLLFYIADLSFDRAPYAGSRGLPTLSELLKIVLGRFAGRVIPHVKHLFPRFLMPNGFVTRHLSLGHESYSYHIINLYDMLVLYQMLALSGYKREELKWLWQAIERAVGYCFEGHLVRYLIQVKDKFIPQLVEALLIYSSFNRDFPRKRLLELVFSLKDRGYRFTSGVYGFDNLVTPEEFQISELSLKNYSPELECLNVSPRDGRFRELLVVNTGLRNEEVDIAFRGEPKRVEVISSAGDRINLPRSLSPRDYVVIRLYNA